MALQIIFPATCKIAETAIKGFQFFMNTLEWLQLIMGISNMRFQSTIPGTLVAANATIEGFQFVMNISDMSCQITFMATLVAAKAAIEGFQFVMNVTDMLLQIFRS